MSLDEAKKIRAVVIFEIIGKPPEHLVETLKKLIEQIDKEKGISVKNKDIKEPVPMKENVKIMETGEEKKIKPQQDFYTSFAEIEVEIDEMSSLAYLMFRYMPAHIEIISPELIALTNNGWNEIFNELIRRLHGYDEVARVLQVEKGILEKRLKEIINKDKNNENIK